MQVNVDEWRSGLWHKALQTLGIDNPEMARALQDKFRTSRLEHFVMDMGVKVGYLSLNRPQGSSATVHYQAVH